MAKYKEYEGRVLSSLACYHDSIAPQVHQFLLLLGVALSTCNLDILEHEVHMFVIGNKLGIQFCAISEPDVDILANALLEQVQGLLIVIHDINLNIIASYDSNFIEITFSEYLYNKVKDTDGCLLCY